MIILAAAVIGLIGGKLWSAKFDVLSSNVGNESSVLDDRDAAPEHARPSVARALRVLMVCLVLWWLPIVLVAILFGTNNTIFREGIFFSKAAVVTFGGAYAVLPYVAQRAVEHFGWLKTGQMMDGLGLAETTPGPLIMVVQFVGFMGGWTHPGNLQPAIAATIGASGRPLEQAAVIDAVLANNFDPEQNFLSLYALGDRGASVLLERLV